MHECAFAGAVPERDARLLTVVRETRAQVRGQVTANRSVCQVVAWVQVVGYMFVGGRYSRAWCACAVRQHKRVHVNGRPKGHADISAEARAPARWCAGFRHDLVEAGEPYRHDIRCGGRLENEPRYAPLEAAQACRAAQIDPALREDVYPRPRAQARDRMVDSGLVDALAPEHFPSLSAMEEPAAELVFKNNVTGAQAPAHGALMLKQRAGQRAPHERLVEHGDVIRQGHDAAAFRGTLRIREKAHERIASQHTHTSAPQRQKLTR